jgi:hypothetical protein
MDRPTLSALFMRLYEPIQRPFQEPAAFSKVSSLSTTVVICWLISVFASHFPHAEAAVGSMAEATTARPKKQAKNEKRILTVASGFEWSYVESDRYVEPERYVESDREIYTRGIFIYAKKTFERYWLEAICTIDHRTERTRARSAPQLLAMILASMAIND